MTRNILIVLLLAGISTSLRAQDIAPFRKGDRVTFVGNSITDGGHYHSYIWLPLPHDAAVDVQLWCGRRHGPLHLGPPG